MDKRFGEKWGVGDWMGVCGGGGGGGEGGPGIQRGIQYRLAKG